MCCKGKKKKYIRAKVYRQVDACGENNLNEFGHVIEGESSWQLVREIYVCALPQSSNSRIVDDIPQDTTIWNLDIKFCEGLKGRDRINYQGSWLQFMGTPFNTSKKCQFLKVRALECEPCCA